MTGKQETKPATPAMDAEPEGRERTRRQPWNGSTRLREDESTAKASSKAAARTSPRRARSSRSRSTRRSLPANKRCQDGATQANDKDDDQRTLTRELLERAVSTAFGGLLQDSPLDTRAFPDVCTSQSSGQSSMRDQENTLSAEARAAGLESKLQASLQASEALSTSQRKRRRQHAEASLRAAADARAVKEFQQRMKLAVFEHRERKLAVQALQARVQREMQFLSATAADLDKREFLLDDAFESFEHALRLELGLVDVRPQS